MSRALLRFYAELNDFLPRTRRQVAFEHEFQGTPSIKDLVESLGIPHGEIDLILANGVSVDFSWKVQDGARISVFPVFEALDIGPLTRVRPTPLRETRFVLDEHLGRLTRYLRMAGIDTRWQNHCGDEWLIQVAAEEHRILLTRDRGLLMRRDVSHGHWVRETEPRRQLAEILERFDLYRSLSPFRRCMLCNGLLQAVAKEAVVDRLPPRVREQQEEFRQCPSCQRVYWKGSHHRRMEQLLAEVVAAWSAREG